MNRIVNKLYLLFTNHNPVFDKTVITNYLQACLVQCAGNNLNHTQT